MSALRNALPPPPMPAATSATCSHPGKKFLAPPARPADSPPLHPRREVTSKLLHAPITQRVIYLDKEPATAHGIDRQHA